ncbi:MAG TPA: SAM-dependent methyltransferase [Miltoncostaea sp.]|nr:SAM-dependent methyltransferase [Miltoncostaea sp.]
MRVRMGAAYFEALYAADEDPWDFAGSPYERAKYDRTVAALGGRRFARGLEVGCSIGVLTARLAERCDRLLAVDVAAPAVAAACARLAGTPGVTVERRTLPDEMPPGPFDLIVASEVLYYWDAALLARGWRALREALAPGGSILAVHWRRPVRHYPQGGDAVHDAIGADAAGLLHAVSDRTDDYRLDRWDRP